MSKSLGNVINVNTIIERGRTDAFRVLALQSHYRVPLTYTEEGLDAANTGLQRLRAAARVDTTNGSQSGEDLGPLVADTRDRFHAAMLDDFDTPRAIAALFDLARAVNRVAAAGGSPSLAEARETLVELAGILGIDLTKEAGAVASDADVETLMALLIEVRARLRTEKQFATADFVRDRLQQEGFILEDTRDGTTWKRESAT
jgi:cysteinyl-tRNA synthetase